MNVDGKIMSTEYEKPRFNRFGFSSDNRKANR